MGSLAVSDHLICTSASLARRSALTNSFPELRLICFTLSTWRTVQLSVELSRKGVKEKTEIVSA